MIPATAKAKASVHRDADFNGAIQREFPVRIFGLLPQLPQSKMLSFCAFMPITLVMVIKTFLQ
jgi:hypothetical protein